MDGIHEMFEEFSGYARLERKLEEALQHRKSSAVERVRLWRILNPAKFKENRKKYRKAWLKRNPEKRRLYRKNQRSKRIEHYREQNRKHAKAYRDRKRLSKTVESNES